MSRVLSQLLSAEEPAFSKALAQLEKASGHTSADIRLTADIATRVQAKIKELGLDPTDTTAKELYHALQGLIGLHDEYLCKAIGTVHDADLTQQLTALVKTLRELTMPRSCWAIRHSVAKKFLKANPPKKVMKQLGYKSIDSMLKREPVTELFCAIRFIETATYQTRLIKSYKKLTPSDFEIRDIEVLLLDSAKWGDTATAYILQRRHNLTHLKEHGTIMLLPLPVQKLRGAVITVLPLALHYINEIRSYSSFFKLQQVRPNFGEIFARTILEDPKTNARVAGQPVHWRILQRHFGKSTKEQTELFEPHVQIEDLFWRKAEEIIYWIEPALKFWEDLDYVAASYPDSVVPLGLMDNAVSYCNQLEFGKQSTGHFRESLWNEIYVRYVGHDAIEQAVVQQLSHDVVSTEGTA